MKAKNVTTSLLNLVAGVFEPWSVVLFIPSEEGKPADLISLASQDAYIDKMARIQPGKGLVGWILRNKAPLWVDSIEENQAYLGYYLENYDPGIKSFMGCPVPGGGALCIDSREAHAFSQDQQKLLCSFAAFIPQLHHMASKSGHSVEVNTYFTALEHMATLRQSYTGWDAYLGSLLEVLKEVTGYQYAAFASWADGAASYVLEGEYPPLLNHQGQAELPLASGIVGWVLRNGEAVFNEGTSSATSAALFGKIPNMPAFAASISLPIVVEGRVCAVLCLASLDARLFSEELRSFLKLVVDDLCRLLEKISLQYTLRKVMPKASLQRQGAIMHDPDAPSPQILIDSEFDE